MTISYSDIVASQALNHEVIAAAIEQIVTGSSMLWSAAIWCPSEYINREEWDDAVAGDATTLSRGQDEKNMFAAFILLSEGYDLDELFDFSNAAPSEG